MQVHPVNDSSKTTVASIIAQKNVNQGKPGNLCYSWRGTVSVKEEALVHFHIPPCLLPAQPAGGVEE
jgi:hypothetical protein